VIRRVVPRERSTRHLDILRPLRLAWELRAAFVSDGRCWGYAGIYRSYGERDFTPDETAFLASVSGTLGAGSRRALLVGARPAAQTAHDGPRLVLLDVHGEPLQVTPAAARLIEEMRARSMPSRAGCRCMPWRRARARGVHDEVRRQVAIRPGELLPPEPEHRTRVGPKACRSKLHSRSRPRGNLVTPAATASPVSRVFTVLRASGARRSESLHASSRTPVILVRIS